MANAIVMGRNSPFSHVNDVAVKRDAVGALVTTSATDYSDPSNPAQKYVVFAQVGALIAYVGDAFDTEQEALDYITNDPDDILK